MEREHVNVRIQADFLASCVASIERYLELLVEYWKAHLEFHIEGGIEESAAHHHRRLVETWRDFHDLHKIYGEISALVLAELRRQQLLPAA